LLASLALVRRVSIGVEVVAVELKRQERECVERWHFHDRHVVGGSDGGGCDHASGARAHVGQSVADAPADGVEKLAIIEFFEEAERIAASHKDGISAVELFDRNDL